MNREELKTLVAQMLRDMEESTPASLQAPAVKQAAPCGAEGMIDDITAVDLRKQYLVANPANREAFLDLKARTPARIGVGRAGARYKTATMLRVRADHAAAQDSVFSDVSEDDDIVMANLSSLGEAYRSAWKRILLADALFLNGDRHMRNFGLIRSARTGEVLRLAPNFDNNQAFHGNPSGRYSAAMLRLYWKTADDEDRENLRQLLAACEKNRYLAEAWRAGTEILNT